MLDSQVATRPALEMRWVPATDEQGHTCMQAVWTEAAAASPAAAHHHAA